MAISGLALGGNTTLAKWRRITGRVITGHCLLPGAILTRGGEIAVLFLNVLAGLSGAILTGGGKLVQ
jgi:hypothetical protein